MVSILSGKNEKSKITFWSNYSHLLLRKLLHRLNCNVGDTSHVRATVKFCGQFNRVGKTTAG
jgi:hypothetical protein